MRFVQAPQTLIFWQHPQVQGVLIAVGFVLIMLLLSVLYKTSGKTKSPRKPRRRYAKSIKWVPTGTSDFTRLITHPPALSAAAYPDAITVTPRMSTPARQPDWPDSNPRLGVDATRQMEAVQHNNYQRTPLLNKEETRLLPVLDHIVLSLGQGHRVMAQTSLGEVIKAKYGSDPDAHTAINSKRLDFAIFDAAGLLVCAVEYQGTGHYQGNAIQRDAIKREALHKAGVPMLEVFSDFSPVRLAADLCAILRPAALLQ